MDEPQKIRRLKKLTANEVSLVNRGAIKRPFLVIKNDQGEPMAGATPQFLLTPEQETRIDGVLAKHQRIAKGGPGSGPRPGGGEGSSAEADKMSTAANAHTRRALASGGDQALTTASEKHMDAAAAQHKVGNTERAEAHMGNANKLRKMAGIDGHVTIHDAIRSSVSKADSDDSGNLSSSDALRQNISAEAAEDASGQDDGLDERGLAALKAVYRILQPFKGQITEDMVDDVLAELDLDDTGEDGQDGDEDGVDDIDVDDAEDDDTLTEDDQAMADDKLPDEMKKAAAPWSPSKPDGMSDEDYGKACAAAKSAFNNIGKKADDADDEDDGNDEDEDSDVKKSSVTKSLLSKMAPEHAELVRKADNARYEAIAKAAALEERVAKMEGERILKSYEEDIKKDCITLGKDPAQQARILKAQFDANPEAGEQYRAILRDSARMTHESGIFKSVGTSHNSGFGGSVPTDGQGSPDHQLQGMLKSVVQKGEAVDEASAWTAVMKTQRGRDLYELSRKGVH